MLSKTGQGSKLRMRYESRLLSTVGICALITSTPGWADRNAGDGPSFDENGVDIISQQISLRGPVNSFVVGPDLAYDHVVSTNPNDVFPAIYHQRLISWGSYITIDQDGIYVVGAEMKRFNYNASNSRFESTDGDRSYITLVSAKNWIYRTANGSSITFKDYSAANTSSAARITKIVSPDGRSTVISHRLSNWGTSGSPDYNIVGPQTISTNTGYMLQFEYQNDVDKVSGYTLVTAVNSYNLATDACFINAKRCPIIVGRPRLTFQWSATGSGTSITSYGATVTNGNGAISKYSLTTTGTVIFSDGTVWATNKSLSVRFPPGNASGSDDITVNTSNGAVTSLVKGGLTWIYGSEYQPIPAHILRTIKYPSGAVTKYFATYNFSTPGDRVLSTTDSLGRITNYSYDSLGRLSRTTYPEGNYVQLARDANGNVTETRQVSKTPGTPPDIVNSRTFSSTCVTLFDCHLPQTSIDPLGNVTNYVYNPTHGGLVSTTLPAATVGAVRSQVRIGYIPMQAYYKNSAGSIVASGQPIYLKTSGSECKSLASCAGTADEIKTSIAYGSQAAGVANNLLPMSVTAASGDGVVSSTTASTYDAGGNVATVDGPLLGAVDTTTFRYDAMGRKIGTIAPDPDGAGSLPNIARRVTIDDVGRSIKTEVGNTAGQSDAAWQGFSPVQSIETKLNAMGQVETEVLKSGATAYAFKHYSYDANGRLDCSAVRMNPAAYATLPPGACTATAAGGQDADRITKTSYDTEGRVTQVQSAYGTARVVTETQGTTPNGQIAYVADGNANRTTYEYDGHDRLVTTRYPVTTVGAGTSSTTDYEQLTYDGGSRVTHRRLRDGTITAFAYDKLNRTTNKDRPGSENDVAYAYDLQDRPTTVTDSSGNFAGYAYDALGRMTEQSSPLGVSGMAYDAASNLTLIRYPDNFYVNYVYDTAANVTQIRENGATSGAGLLASYSYDSLGRRSLVNFGNGTSRTYAYDPVNRLAGIQIDLAGTASDQVIGAIGGVGTVIGYNSASQIQSITHSNDAYAYIGRYNVSRTYSANGLNQYTAAGTSTFGYADSRGNLTSSTSTPPSGPVVTASYAYDSENHMTLASVVPAGGSPNGSFIYDPIGRLYQFNSGSTTTRFGYAGTNIIGEYDGSTLLRRYVYGPGTDEPVVWYEGAGNRRWLQADERGSVVAVSDASGSAIAINRYDEYGIPQSTNLGKFQYTGQAWLPELGMYYYKARIYSPSLGRFMQTDPIGYGDGLNWYAYGGNDPVNRTDPSGMTGGYGPFLVDVVGSTPYNSPYGDAVTVFGSRWRIPSSGLSTSLPLGWGPWSGSGFGSSSQNFNYAASIPRYSTGSMATPQKEWQRCQDNDQWADWAETGLTITGYIGDATRIAGFLTANPILIGAGTAISIGSDLGLAAVHAQQGDVGGLVDDAVGAGFGLLPGGKVSRLVGGSAGDWGRNAAGQFVKNYTGKRLAQDATWQTGQKVLASGGSICQ